MQTIRWSRRRTAAVVLTFLAVALAACEVVPPAGTEPISSTPQPQGCITQVGATSKMVVAGCGGDITYNVSVPAQCLDFACGLIVDVHGWTMSGDSEEANTQIAAIGREEGYIVVQPNAPGATPSWSTSHYPFVASFVELAKAVWRVDARRVHITGFSQGGAMTFWMRCNRPELFASAAPMSMAGTACPAGAAVPTLYIQGNNDVFVSAAAVTNTINSFVNTYGLGAAQTLRQVPNEYTLTRRTNAAGLQFFVLIHDYSTGVLNGHCIVGAPAVNDLYGCDQPTDLPAGRLIVDFFKVTPKPTI